MFPEYQIDSLNIRIDELEEYLYKIEFNSIEDRHAAIKSFSSKISWQYSVPEIIDHIRNPSLRMFGRSIANSLHIERINYSLHKISQRQNNDYKDLEEGVFVISRMGNPYLSFNQFKEKLDNLTFRVNELFQLNQIILTDDVKLHLLSRVLYQEEGYSGNKADYHNPENSYVAHVLITKLGIPISLSVVYLLVAHRLKLPVYGINLPLHFMLYYESSDFSTFIDPFHGGILVEKDTCIKFLEANGFTESPDYFSKTSTVTILKRILTNLLNIYKKNGMEDMEILLSKQINILQKKNKKTN